MKKEKLIDNIKNLQKILLSRNIKMNSCSITYFAGTTPIYHNKTPVGWYEGKKKQIIISWEEE